MRSALSLVPLLALIACASGSRDVSDVVDAGTDPGADGSDVARCVVPLPATCSEGAVCDSLGTCMGEPIRVEICRCIAGRWNCTAGDSCDYPDIPVMDPVRDPPFDPAGDPVADPAPVDLPADLADCAPAGAACASGKRCCDGTVCFGGICAPDVGRPGDTCSASRPCGWLSGGCVDGVCACAHASGACQVDSDCCAFEGPCVDGHCGGTCVLGGDASCDADHPCCGLAGRTVCQYTCTWPDNWLGGHAPGCEDLVWNGATLVPPDCTTDDQCCPWIGPCVGGACGACMVTAEDCARDLDCCEGHCELGKCAGHACTGRGLACGSDAECCSPPCSGGTCGCQGVGSPCTRAEECCMGRCVAGACAADCPTDCQADADCCAWHLCVAGKCLSERPDVAQFECKADLECTRGWYGDSGRCDRGVCQRACSGYGARNRWAPRCSSDGDCCESSRCLGGVCIDDCGPAGSGCWDSFQCCGDGAACVNGTCTGCGGIGAPCQGNNACCQGLCDKGFCAKPCIPNQNFCMSAGDCCDSTAACVVRSAGAPATCCWADGHAGASGGNDCCGYCDGTRCQPVPPIPGS